MTMSAASINDRVHNIDTLRQASLMRVWFVGVLIVCLEWGCSNPSPGPSQTVNLDVVPQPDIIAVGSAVTLIARDAASGAVVQPTWSSSNPSVAIVSSDQLRGLRPGLSTIGAVYHDSSLTFSVKVVPNYAGSYAGTIDIIDCTDGVSPGFCRGKVPAGPDSMFARWSQTKDVVSGLLSLRVGDGQVQGSIGDDGAVSIAGTRLSAGKSVVTAIDSWNTVLNDAGTTLSGSFRMTIMRPDGSVDGVARAEIRGIERVP